MYDNRSWLYPHPTRPTLYRKSMRSGFPEAPYSFDVSEDDGQTWQTNSVFAADPFFALGSEDERSERVHIEPLSGRIFRTIIPFRVLSSSDQGRTWIDIRLNNKAQWPIAFDASGRLVTASPEGGLLRSARPVDAGAVDAPATAAALRVWPNPARGMVRVEGGGAGPVEMVVTDVLGRVVARVSAEASSLAWDASAAAPGLYVVRFVGGDGAARTARVVVAR